MTSVEVISNFVKTHRNSNGFKKMGYLTAYTYENGNFEIYYKASPICVCKNNKVNIMAFCQSKPHLKAVNHIRNAFQYYL